LSRQIKHIIILFFGLIYFQSEGQIVVDNHHILIEFDSISKIIHLTQTSSVTNKSGNKKDTIYFYAWANAYKNKKTPLATRFIENYDLNFHFARKKHRGHIAIKSIEINKHQKLSYSFIKNKIDILQVIIENGIAANEKLKIQFNYDIKLPNSKFTGYGIDNDNNVFLRHFYFSPALSAKLYNNKDLDDMPEKPTNFAIEINGFAKNKKILSSLNKKILIENNISNPKIIISNDHYNIFNIEGVKIFIYKEKPLLQKTIREKKLQRLIKYFEKNTGKYVRGDIIISQNDFKKNKIYGLDLLPKFINPFSNELVWEMKILHQLSIKYVNQMQIDKRKYAWISNGLASYLEYQYFQKYYPNLKLIGNISKFKIAKFYYASQVKMTEKYPWLYLYMARMNKDQALNVSLDSLSNFSRTVANPNKSALGFVMLKDEMKAGEFVKKIKQFYQYSLKNEIDDSLFFNKFEIKNKHNWYIKYINSRQKYDYKIKKERSTNDSLYIKIIQKEQAAIPAKIYGLRNDTIVWQKQFSAIRNDTIIGAPKNISMVGLNYFNNYPELQNNNNYIKTNSCLGLGKSLQIRLYQDFENPTKQQIYINPFFEYNYYDGVQIGGQIMNESVLHNNLNYSITPVYGFKSKSVTGSFGVSYQQYFDDFNPYALLYGFNTKYYHYDHDLTYIRINPYFVIKNRNKHIRKRQGSNILFQYMYIDKEAEIFKTEADNYQVFNANYSYFNINVVNDFFYSTDLQFSDKFGKLSTKLRYRFLSNKNRQWDFRIYAGYFLYNHTQSDYFSFALDRPTDYLFQYNYYGRSESSGIFHQQFIWAEGGFKTFFDDQFANEFLISNNINIGIWKWFNLYGDIALKKNKAEKAKFYYDTGLRINLVQDYFEVFFPVYSSLGNELKQTDYHQKIRLVFSINLEELFDMFKRGWY
jgi:hypothetical protein